MSLPSTKSLTASLALAASLSAQADFQPTAPTSAARAPQSLQTFVPVHRNVFRDTEIWAAGSNYKVRLDSGFEFVPQLGRAWPRNLPLRWSTQSVTIGGIELAYSNASEKAIGDDRYEYHHGGVVEAYQLSMESVEQTFHIASVATPGDLVVVGQIVTPLTAPRIQTEHRSITFRADDGTPIIEYGAATVIDSRGQTFPMLTTHREGRIELRLDATSLASAAFPIVIDPVILSANPTQDVGTLANAALDVLGPISPRVNFVAFTRIFSASDHDTQAVMTNSDFSNRALVFVDLTNSWSNEHIAVVEQEAPRRYALAMEQRQGLRSMLGLYAHSALDPTLNSGTSRQVSAALGEQWHNPAIGATRDSNSVIVVCDHKRGGSSTTSVRGVLWNSDGSLPTQTAAVANTTGEVQPSVSSHAAPEWQIVWPDNSGSRNEVLVRAMSTQGIMPPVIHVLQSSTSRTYSQPKVAGGDGQFMVTYVQSPTGIGTNAIRAARFERGAAVVVTDDRTLQGGRVYTNRALAYDTETKSHWAAMYNTTLGLDRDLCIDRLLLSCAVADSLAIGTTTSFNAYPGSLSFGRNVNAGQRFPYVYAPAGNSNAVEADTYEYPAAVFAAQPYGTGCSTGSEQESWSPSIAGSEFFRGTVTGAPNTLASCFIGQLSGFVPLDSIGMTGCTMLIEPLLAVTLPAGYDGNGSPFVEFALPYDPVFLGSVNTQWVLAQPGANPLGIVTRRGFAHTVL